ncbi:MAG: radical SAM-associated putative lipoprotein [Bacteroidota bacterium]
MKSAQIKFFKAYNGLLAVILALLGFSTSCEETRVEYGTPSAKFIVNGTIESKESSKPIKNLRVVMQYDTTYSDGDGNYQVAVTDFPDDQDFQLEVADVDGPENGDYQDLDTIVQFRNPEFINGDGDWYSGETQQEINIKLNPKE